MVRSYSVQIERFKSQGCELRAYTMGHKVERSTSSVRRRVPRIAYNTPLKLRTNLSQIPPWCGALVGLNLHFMPLWATSASTLTMFHFWTISRSSFTVPIKLVPLSAKSLRVYPYVYPYGLLVLNSHNTRTGLHNVTIWKWTTRVVRQVKTNSLFFSEIRP